MSELSVKENSVHMIQPKMLTGGIKMSLTDKISAHVEATLPVLKLIRAENIDFEKAFVASPKMLAWKLPDHIEVFFKLKNIDENSKKILDNILVQYLRKLPTDMKDNYYIVYDTCDKLAEGMKDKENGGIFGFAVEYGGMLCCESCEILTSTLTDMESLSHKELPAINLTISSTAEKCFEWIKSHIREVISDNIRGVFVSDNVNGSVYYQRRIENGQYIDYIINNWSDKINGKPIEWVDISDQGKVFSALN